MSNFSHIRALVIGVGSIGKRHLRNLHTLGVSTLAFSDPNCNEAQELATELGAEVFTDHKEALAAFKPTIALVCSPTQFHISQAIDAANSGAHIFIEKPLSHTHEDIEKLESILHQKGLSAMVACNMRFNAGPKKIKELLDQRVIGDVISTRIHASSFLPRWRRSVPYKDSYSADPAQGGVLRDCIHEIDLALWYFGPATLEHASVIPATSIDIPVDGTADLILRHKQGSITTLHLSFVQPTWRRGCEIVGARGTIEWELRAPSGSPEAENDDPRIRVYDEEGKLVQNFPAESDRNSSYLEEMQHFLSCIERGTEDRSTFEDGKNALRIALMAREVA